MNCPFKNQIESYFHGLMDFIQMDRLENHLRTCSACQEEYSQFFMENLAQNKDIFAKHVGKLSQCLCDETMDEFIDDKLTDEERKMVADHLGKCEICFWQVQNSIEMRIEDLQSSRASMRLEAHKGQISGQAVDMCAPQRKRYTLNEGKWSSEEITALVRLLAAVGLIAAARLAIPQTRGRRLRMSEPSFEAVSFTPSNNFYETNINMQDDQLRLLSSETVLRGEDPDNVFKYFEDKRFFWGLLGRKEAAWRAVGEVGSKVGLPLGIDDPNMNEVLLCLGLDKEEVAEALKRAAASLGCFPDGERRVENLNDGPLSFIWIYYQVQRNVQ